MRLNLTQMMAVLYRLWDKSGQPNESMIFLTEDYHSRTVEILDYVTYEYYDQGVEHFMDGVGYFIDHGEIHDRIREFLGDDHYLPPPLQRFPNCEYDVTMVEGQSIPLPNIVFQDPCIDDENREELGPPF